MDGGRHVAMRHVSGLSKAAKLKASARPHPHTTPNHVKRCNGHIFHAPTKFNEKKYDCVVVCVDRHSGWMVAIKRERKGLTGAKVAKKMLKFQWQTF